jgi:hypothetical protein
VRGPEGTFELGARLERSEPLADFRL